MQKLKKNGRKTSPKKNKGCEEDPGVRAPGSDILHNNLKDKKAPRSGDRTRCFSFFASLVADEGLWMQKAGGNWSNTNKKHIETKTKKPLKKVLGPNIPENLLLVSNVVVWYGEVEASSLQERKV